MAQISFYSIAKGDATTRLQVACRLIEKAYSLGHQIFVQVEDASQLRQLDELLWQFKPSSFVPHTSGAEESEAVQISLNAKDSQGDVFVNLSLKQCEQLENFKRISEIVGPDEHSLAAGRESYRFYRTQGFTPETHKI